MHFFWGEDDHPASLADDAVPDSERRVRSPLRGDLGGAVAGPGVINVYILIGIAWLAAWAGVTTYRANEVTFATDDPNAPPSIVSSPVASPLASPAASPGASPVAGVVCWYPITDLTALDHTVTDSFEAHLLGGPIDRGDQRRYAAGGVLGDAIMLAVLTAHAPGTFAQPGEAPR